MSQDIQPRVRQVCPLTTKEVVDKVLQFAEALNARSFYMYQRLFAYRLVEAILLNDGSVLTALWARQCGKCLGRGTPVLMFDGTIKPVEQVEVGDLLMGDDSTPRTVLSLARGRERMVRVVPTSRCHEPYVVNRSHIMSIKRRVAGSSAERPRKIEWVTQDVPVVDLLEASLEDVRGFTVPVDFEATPLAVDPYYFGVWLGSSEYSDAFAPGVPKGIPQVFKSNRREVRLQLLAGLADSDSYKADYDETCRLECRCAELASDIQWLCRSLGFRADIEQTVGDIKACWTVSVYDVLRCTSGGTGGRHRFDGIPLSGSTCYPFTLEELPEDEYFGFTIDGNKRFLLGDCTVTHNTETISAVSIALAVLLPVLSKTFPDDPRFMPFAKGFLVGVYAPVKDQASTSFDRMRNRLSDPVGRAILSDPEIGVELIVSRGDTIGLSNGSTILARTASENSQIEGKTHHLVICVDGNAKVTTPTGDVCIGQLVESGYTGKVLAFDHKAGSPVWADVLDRQRIETQPSDSCFELAFDNGTSVVATGDHLWWVESEGKYVRTDALEAGQGSYRGVKEVARLCCIKRVDSPAVVYDLTTSTGNFFVNGVLGHNCEESQKLSRTKVDKEIRPMLASTNGVMVHIGTAWVSRGGFHQSIQQNEESRAKGGPRNHFEIPYDVVLKEKEEAYQRTKDPTHLQYVKFVQGEIKRIGVDSDEFKMNFRCLWQEMRAIALRKDVLQMGARPDMIAYPMKTRTQVAGLDIGKVTDFTVLTIMDVDMANPIQNLVYMDGADIDLQVSYPKTIIDWFELGGAFEGDAGQYARLINILKAFSVQVLCVDATAIGDPVAERIATLCGDDLKVIPFKFGSVTKSHLYKYYLGEWVAGRIAYPSHPETRERIEYRKFIQEHEDLDKVQVGEYAICKAPDGLHDDYPSSGALACWAEKQLSTAIMPIITESNFVDFSGFGNSSKSGEAASSRSDRYKSRWLR